MSAQVTEAHHQLALAINGDDSEFAWLDAQLIADSEARATAELRGALALGQENCDDVFEDLRLERDQLRTEIDRLHAINAMRESAIARAERAEADADSTRERALTLANSLDGAQAELAAERKKVKTLHKALGDVKNSICRNVPDGYSQPCVDESADECDRIIDAAMKEGAK